MLTFLVALSWVALGLATVSAVCESGRQDLLRQGRTPKPDSIARTAIFVVLCIGIWPVVALALLLSWFLGSMPLIRFGWPWP
jgi:nitrate reductase NapE component